MVYCDFSMFLIEASHWELRFCRVAPSGVCWQICKTKPCRTIAVYTVLCIRFMLLYNILAYIGYVLILCIPVQGLTNTVGYLFACIHALGDTCIYIYIFASSWATTFTPMRVARDIYILTLSNSQVVTFASGVDYHWAFWLLHPLVQLAGGFFIQPEFLLFSWLGLSSRNQSSFFLCLTVPALGAIWIWPIRGVNLHVKLLPRKFLYFWNRHTFVAKVAWCLASSRTKENGMVEEVPVNEESGDGLFVLWSS